MIDKNCTQKDIGCFTHCGEIILPLIAREFGVHSLVFRFNGAKTEIPFAATPMQPFAIPNRFNEYSEVCFYIIQPSGQLYEYRKNAIINGFENIESEDDASSFRITIRPGYSLAKPANIELLLNCCNEDCSSDFIEKLKFYQNAKDNQRLW